MKIYTDKSLSDFEFWSGAIDTADKITEADKWEELETILEEQYPDGIDETALNDLLWFEPEWIFEMLGIEEEEEEEEEEEDEIEYEEGETEKECITFDSFCNKFSKCEKCPYDNYCKTMDDCRERYLSLKWPEEEEEQDENGGYIIPLF